MPWAVCALAPSREQFLQVRATVVSQFQKSALRGVKRVSSRAEPPADFSPIDRPRQMQHFAFIREVTRATDFSRRWIERTPIRHCLPRTVCDPRTGANQFVSDVSQRCDSLVFLYDVIGRLSTDVTSSSFPRRSINLLLEFAYPDPFLAGFAESNDCPSVCHVVTVACISCNCFKFHS
jgi:hypothetical protein